MNKALELDPGYADAYISLSDVLNLMIIAESDPEKKLDLNSKLRKFWRGHQPLRRLILMRN